MPRLNRSTTGALTATQVLGGTKLSLRGLALWVIGQNFGALYTGQATDPNTAPLVGLTRSSGGGRCRRLG